MHCLTAWGQWAVQLLQCIASLPSGVVWCGVVWCGVVWCGVVWCGVVWCGVVWCAVRCGAVRWCGVVWCGAFVLSPRPQAEPSSSLGWVQDASTTILPVSLRMCSTGLKRSAAQMEEDSIAPFHLQMSAEQLDALVGLTKSSLVCLLVEKENRPPLPPGPPPAPPNLAAASLAPPPVPVPPTPPVPPPGPPAAPPLPPTMQPGSADGAASSSVVPLNGTGGRKLMDRWRMPLRGCPMALCCAVTRGGLCARWQSW